jgi:RNA polymerase sigma factor (sigma-70 family)
MSLLPYPSKAAQSPHWNLRIWSARSPKLPIEQRQVILLVGLEGMPYDEVASILNVPVGTVRSRLSRGRDLLRYRMGMQEQRSPQHVAEKHIGRFVA